MRIRIMATASVVALCANGAWAQDEETEDQIVVSGTAVETLSSEALQPAEVFTIEALQDDFAGGIGDTLAKAPGISSTYFGPAASRPIIRGLGGDRIRVLRNGVGLVDASTVSVDHAVTADVLEAKRIEVLRGPAAIAYGGNAVGGVVNVIDAAIASEPVDGLIDGAFRAGVTSVDEGYQVGARGQMNAGPFVLSLEASRRDAESFDIPGFAESDALIALEELEEEGEEHGEEEEVSGTVINSDYTFETLGGGVSLVGDWGFAGVSLKIFDAEYGLPGGHEHEEEGGEEEGPELFAGPRLDMNQVRWDSRGEFAFNLSGFDAITYSAGYSTYEHEEIEPNGEVATEFENEGWEARAALVRRGDKALTGTVGVQALRSDFSATGEEAFVQPVVTEDYGIFGAGRYDLGGFGFEAGGRFETRSLEPSVGEDADFDLFSASVGGFVRPMDDVFLSANLSRSERAPVDVELYSDGPHLATNAFEIGDPTLDKETAWGLDFAGRYDAGRFSVDAGVFATSFEDFIFLAATGGEEDGLPVFEYRQDDAMFYGAEIAVDTVLAETSVGDFGGDVSLEYVRAETDDAGDLPRIPPLSATFGLDYDYNWLSARGEVIYTAEQDDVAEFELPTDSYTLVNLSTTFRPFADQDVRLIFGVDNVTDEEARLHTSFLKDQVPLPGRNYKFTIASTF